MTTSITLLRAASVLWCAAGYVAAQVTWVVPSNADLASYIQAAAPGDTLRLGATHPPFTLNKGLNLIGSGTQIVPPHQGNTVTFVNVPAGQRASLSGVMFAMGVDPNWFPPLIFSGRAEIRGDVTLQAVSGTSYVTAPVTVFSGAVLMRNCTMTGDRGAPGLSVQGGTCSVVACTMRGSDGLQLYQGPDFDGAPGLSVSGGNVWLMGSQVRGGHLGWIYGVPALNNQPALVVSGNATVHVAQSTLVGGNGDAYVPGSPAIEVISGVVRQARNTLTPGATQTTPPVPATVGNVQAAPELVGLAASGSLTVGGTFTLLATVGPAQLPLFVAASLAPSAGAHPLVAQPVLGGGNGLLIQLTVLAPAPGALATTAITVPNNPALRGVCVAWQAFQWTGSLFQASAIVAGVVN